MRLGSQMSDTSVQVFDNGIGGELHALMDESGEVWFIAKDVCSALELSNVGQALSQLKEDEVNSITINDGNRGNPNKAIISEPGLYHLLNLRRIGSIKDEGTRKQVKKFQHQVNHEILPSIRRNGGYMVARADETPEQLLARALKLADATLRERDARIASLTPRAEFYDATMKGERWMSVTEAARQLHQYDRSITRKDVFAFCMQRHIITSDKQASKLGIDRGYVANYQPPAYFDQTTGEMVRPKPYAKVTSKGFTWLLEGMCGQRRLPDAE